MRNGSAEQISMATLAVDPTGFIFTSLCWRHAR